MARSLQVSLALAMLAAGGAALQLAADEPARGCGQGFVGFEHLDEGHPSGCLVYCVPAGACVKKAEDGHMASLNLAGRGDCKGRGFTKSAHLGNTTTRIAAKLGSFVGPCKGMKVLKFTKPVPPWAKVNPPKPPQKILPQKAICGMRHAVFHSIEFRGLKARCTLYCVPDGVCLKHVKAGEVLPANVTFAGSCEDSGFVLPTNNATEHPKKIESEIKPCARMKTHLFKKEPKQYQYPPPPAEALGGAAS